MEAEKCVDSGMGQRKVFYCRYEGENFQRRLEEFRAERESSGLNIDSRLGLAVREERKGGVRDGG